MCDLLGISSRCPVTVEMSFAKLLERAKSVNPDGWGAVFYEENDAYVFREPRPASDSRLAGLLGQGGIVSRMMISHIRKATTGAISLRNTHPFIREVHGDLYSFAFNGDVPGIFDLDISLEKYLPIGDTDGELAFCWILEQLLSQSKSDSWKHTTQVLTSLGNQLARQGPANFLYSDSKRLYAYASRRRHPDGEYPPGLYYLSRRCAQDLDLQPCIGLKVQSPAKCEQEVALIASIPLSSEGWTPFKEGQLIVVEDGRITFSGQT